MGRFARALVGTAVMAGCALAGCALLSGCLDRPFVCKANAECVHNGVAGVCEADRRCSFPDPACPSQRRYADYGTAHRCVGGGMDAGICGGPGDPCCAKNTCQAGLACQNERCACTVTAVVGGDAHTCALQGHGHVACWGNNSSGQLGDGTALARSEPQQVTGITSAIGVAAHDNHACAVLADGSAVCWGGNARGQLGDGSTTARPLPRAVTRLTGAVELVAGARHTCARKSDGTVACWGDNNRGQLGDGTTVEHFLPEPVMGIAGAVQLTAGDEFSCARLADGRVSCWGTNGRRETDPTLAPVASTAEVPVIPTPRIVAGISDAVSLASGAAHTCAGLRGGTTVCWGANTSGQGGRGDATTTLAVGAVSMLGQAQFMAAGDSFSCGSVDGAMWCWGLNDVGQLAVGEPASIRVPLATTVNPVVGLGAGSRHACALLPQGGLACWGDRSRGQLGDDYPFFLSRPTPVPLGEPVASVAGGSLHTCARLASGRISCWGEASSARLGPRETAMAYTPVALSASVSDIAQIAAGTDFTCVRRNDGAVACWGRGDGGQLGDGNKDRQSAMPVPVALPDKALGIATGGAHACAVLASHKVACWGGNKRGQVGNPAAMTDVVAKPFVVPTITDAVAVAAGLLHTCVLRADGRVACWGAGENGQLGLGERVGTPTPVTIDGIEGAVEIAAGGSHNCARNTNGIVSCWGLGTAGQLGSGVLTDKNYRPMDVPDLPGPAAALSAGVTMSCAAVPDHGVYCWGQNRWGEVGDGSRALRSTPVRVLDLGTVASLAAGESHVCAVDAAGALSCWGKNVAGETGAGVAPFRAEPRAVTLGCQ